MESPGGARGKESRAAHLKVFGDHLEGAFEDGLEDARHLGGHGLAQLADDGRKHAQHLCIPAASHAPPRQKQCPQGE